MRPMLPLPLEEKSLAGSMFEPEQAVEMMVLQAELMRAQVAPVEAPGFQPSDMLRDLSPLGR